MLINNVKLIKKGIAIKTIGKFGVTKLQKSSAQVQRSTIFFYLFLFSSSWLLYSCAKPVSPDGGPKDDKPPVVIACDPPNMDTKFSGSSFRIDFNEFINLRNPVSEIFISPPLRKPLESRLRGKSLVVKFDDSLALNTTYSINFGASIADLTEGNLLKGFNYVFSTGDYVDTLSLHGNLKAAFDLKPQKDVFIELYLNNNDTIQFDSLPLRVAPYYITKTDDQGNFIFHNLQNGKFKLFALADLNGDLIFNQPTEKIAFSDSLVTPYYIPIPKQVTKTQDTSSSDSLRPQQVRINNADSLHKVDSIRKVDSIARAVLNYPSYSLFLFEERDSIQRLMKTSSPMEAMVLLTFRFPAKNLRVVPLNFDSVAPWCMEESSKHRDSVRLWITRQDVDSLIAKIVIENKVLDTVRIELKNDKSKSKSSQKGSQRRLTLLNSASGSGLNYFKNNLIATFSYPLIRWDFTKVFLIDDKDTIHPEISFTDSLKRKIIIRHKWQEEKSYRLMIPDSVFFGIQDITNDTIRQEFKTKGEKDFGNLILMMNMEKRPGQYIVQLMSDNETVIYDSRIITGSEKIRFDFMPPGKYKLKAIHDRNRNSNWDTGNYKLNIQPEEVIYFPKAAEIRANWDVEETWN